MLGLRALYFAVSRFMQTFHFLHYGFASIITIVGVKMLLSDGYKVPIEISLVLIVFILLVCVIVSLLRPRRVDLKLLFGRTERLGLIPFRHLLLIENIIDLGDLQVRHAMRGRSGVRVIQLDTPWEENLKMIRQARLSRYPLVEGDGAKPLGILHVKDLVLSEATGPMTADRLKELTRPCLEVYEDLPLEEALARFQRRYEQMAIVFNATGEWTGIITVEDVLEEMVGKIGDEFDLARVDRLISLADALSPGRVVFELRARSMSEAIQEIIDRIPAGGTSGRPADDHPRRAATRTSHAALPRPRSGVAARPARWDRQARAGLRALRRRCAARNHQ
jgi:CBS domain-containing protein